MADTCTFASLLAGQQPEGLNALLAEYPSVVPAKLADLEEQRLTIVPSALARRREEGKSCLVKDELIKLVEWKLSHGTFRPSLKSLVQQNSEQNIQDITTEGFRADSPKDALAILTKLKGIGPATASLLLSTNDPEGSPFFSDELSRWVFWEDKPGCRWDRKIKYSAKEYLELVKEVDAALNAQGTAFTALELEKIAYVLGKKQANLAAGSLGKSGDGEKSSAKEEVKRKAPEAATDSAAKKAKRNAEQKMQLSSAAPPDARPRRSTRSSAKAASG